jgi:tetratricopeptide (TPR) repeat protein
MKCNKSVLSAVAVCASIGWMAGCGNAINSLRARDQLNKGVNAFKNANYPQAVEHFKTAIQYDPNFTVARSYLASAYMSQYVPGAESEENKRNAEAATKGFMEVLERDPNNTLAVKSLGFLAFSQKKFDEATKWYRKLIELNANDKEAYYNIAVMDWTKAFQPNAEVRAKIGMRPDEPGPIRDKKAREQLKEKNEPVIKEGIEMLQKALAIDPNYDDAMGYLSLMYRQQADIADSPDESKKITAQADQWMQKTLELKKKKTEGSGTPKAS